MQTTTRTVDRAAMTRYHNLALKYKSMRHAALDRIPGLIKSFMDHELTAGEYMTEYQKLKDTVSKCQQRELECARKALGYSGI